MTFPRRLLHDDEQIIFDLRPHWIRVVIPAVPVVVVFAACVAGFVLWKSAPTWFGIVLAAVLFVDFGYFATKLLGYKTTSLVLTSSRVIYRTGVLRRFGREIPLSSVQDTTFSQSLLERVVGAGSVTIESAGERGAEPFRDVAHPESVQSVINEAIGALGRDRQTSVPTPRVPNEFDRLDDLQRRGVITAAERDAHRARLLGEGR